MRIPSPAEELDNKKVDPDARRIWEEALTRPEFGDVSVIWCYSAGSGSDHRNGRCCDFMVTHTDRTLSDSQRVAMGDAIVAYFIRHHARLHVQGIIWRGHVWGFPNTPETGKGREPHETYRGPVGTARKYLGADQHMDHVHVQVNGEPAATFLHTEERNPMPSPEELWDWDHATAPDYAKTKENPTWKPRSLLVEACQQAHQALVIGQENAKKLDDILAALTKPTDPPATKKA